MIKNLIGGCQVIDLTSVNISYGLDGEIDMTEVFPKEWEVIRTYMKNEVFSRKVIDKPLLIKIRTEDSELAQFLMTGISTGESIYGIASIYGETPSVLQISYEGGLVLRDGQDIIQNNINDGAITIKTDDVQPIEIPLEKSGEYSLVINTDDDTIAILESNDNDTILESLVGCKLIGYNENGLLISGLISFFNGPAISCGTTIPSSTASAITSWKIFTK